jgi:hypothetical protein
MILGPYFKITSRLPSFIHERNSKNGSELCLGSTDVNLEWRTNCSKIYHCFIIFSILKMSVITSSHISLHIIPSNYPHLFYAK